MDRKVIEKEFNIIVNGRPVKKTNLLTIDYDCGQVIESVTTVAMPQHLHVV